MFMSRDSKFIDIATRFAAGNQSNGGARIGAVLTIKNKIISFGMNQKKTHPFQAEYSKNAAAIELHAETDAIKNALQFVDSYDLKRATLYIARVKQYGPRTPLYHGLAKPCIGCARCIATFGLKRVVYTTDEHNKFSVLF